MNRCYNKSESSRMTTELAPQLQFITNIMQTKCSKKSVKQSTSNIMKCALHEVVRQNW